MVSFNCFHLNISQLPCLHRRSSRFSSPSQFSMDLAAKFLEDQNFVKQLLDKSHRVLLKIRLLTEKLFDEAGLKYEKKGYVFHPDKHPSLPVDAIALTVIGTLGFLCG